MPWIIEETGFAATDDPADPYVNMDWGTLADQKNYAKISLERARDCGATGYTWWQYKEPNWDIPIENTLGLFYRKDGTPKPAAEEFQNFNPFATGSGCRNRQITITTLTTPATPSQAP